MKANCHPSRPALFTKRVAKPWELGLCAQCVVKVRETRNAERVRVRAKEERTATRSAERVPRGSPLQLLSEAAYMKRVIARARKLGGTPGVYVEAWVELIQSMDGQCVYCLKRSMRLAPSHLLPLRRGGKDQQDNVLPACPRCINCKGRRLITEWPAAKEMCDPPLYAALVRRTQAMLVKLDAGV